jgi:hypothetical protein
MRGGQWDMPVGEARYALDSKDDLDTSLTKLGVFASGGHPFLWSRRRRNG